MEQLYNRLTGIMKGIRTVLEIISGAGVIIGTGMVVVFAAMRYFFGTGFGWSEEAVRMIILFGIFCMCGNVTADGGMVRLSILIDNIHNEVVIKILEIISMAVCLVIGVMMSYWGTQVFINAKGQMSLSTYFPRRLQYLSIPVSMYLLVIIMVLKLILLFIEFYRLKNKSQDAKGEVK